MTTHASTIAPGQRALRKGRVSIPNQIYLITTVTHKRQPFFAEWQSAVEAVRVTLDRRVLGSSRFLTWVLMPDHFHGLLCLGESELLEETVRRFKGYTARQVNRMAGRTGALWQAGFHDHALREEEDLQVAARYLVANPLRAGLVERIGDYPFWNAQWI